MCAEDYSNARQKKEKPTKLHSLKKRSLDSNNFHDYLHDFEYDTKNLIDYKSPLYVYMPPAFQTEYLNDDTNNLHQPITIHEAYNEIYNKIISLPEIRNTYQVVDEIKESSIELQEPVYKTSLLEPDAFIANVMTSNNRPDITHSLGGFKQEFIPSEVNGLLEDIYDAESKELKGTTTFIESTTITNIFEDKKEIKVSVKNQENACEFGSGAICGTLSNGTVKTFSSICEMVVANMNLNNSKYLQGDFQVKFMI